MIGILTEKPSAKKNFAYALGGEVGSYQGEQYKIVASHGHLFEFVDPDEMVDIALSERYKTWDVSYLPWDEEDLWWTRKLKPGAKKTLYQIKQALADCNEIIIATDNDPSGEGQLLAWEILSEGNIHANTISRMYFADEEPQSIQKAFRNREIILGIENDSVYDKAFFRTRWDYLSMQFTRIATKFGDGRSVLRQGRLKSAMVLITGDGLKAVQEYKKIPYFQNRFRDENGVVYSSEDEPSFAKKEDVPQTYEESGVKLVSKEIKHQAPPKLLDLASLSGILAGQGFRANDVLDTYQKMYEAHIVSYPRTEDKVITDEQFRALLPLADKIAHVVGVDHSLLTHRYQRKTHVKTSATHGANRPGGKVPESLQELTKYGRVAPLIYDLVAKSYLAMLADDYEYEQQKGVVVKYPEFTGSVNIPQKFGWKEILEKPKQNDEPPKGIGTIARPFIYEGVPPKPPTPTTKWLMKQLEKHDVGTGSTRTSIYAQVVDESYRYPLLLEKNGKLSMTNFGNMSYTLLKGTHIGDLSTTEGLMATMREIEYGSANAEDKLKEVQTLVREDIETMRGNSKNIKEEWKMAEYTPKEKYVGDWRGKHIQFTREWNGRRFSDEECEQLLAGDEIALEGFVGKGGRPYGVTGKLGVCEYRGRKFVGFIRTGFTDTGNMGGDIQDKEKFAGKWKRSMVSFNRVFNGYRFTDEECVRLLNDEEINIPQKKKDDDSEYWITGKLQRMQYKGHKFVGFKRTGFVNMDAFDDGDGEFDSLDDLEVEG